MLTELDVINEMLASLGEAPLNEVDEDHPLVANGLRKLRIANAREQNKGWWFNEDLVRLMPDPSTGYVYTPQDAINITPLNPWQRLTTRGRMMFDPGRENGFVINQPIGAKVRRLIPFEDLPPSANDYIGQAAIVDFQRDYDADRFRYEQTVQAKREAWVVLRADDIRNRGVNLLYTNSNMSAMNYIGMQSTPYGVVLTDHYYGPTAGVPSGGGAVVVPTVPDWSTLFNDAVED